MDSLSCCSAQQPPRHSQPTQDNTRAAAALHPGTMSSKNVVIIFGATGSVGHAMLDFILKQKVMGDSIKVVAVSSDEAKVKELEGQYKEGLQAVALDAKDAAAVSQLLESHKGEVLGVVNLVGDYEYTPLADVDEARLMSLIQDNVVTGFNVLKAACPALAESGGGNLVCIGAAAVGYGMKGHEAWAGAKGAVEAMHRSAAATWAGSNVRINCVAPGLVASSGASAAVSQDTQLAKLSEKLYPLRRLATPEDVAWAACWLSHPKTTFTTGHALPVDGGLTAVQTTGLATAAAANE